MPRREPVYELDYVHDPALRDGGLYSGYFTDPEGNGWEIVWSPVMRPGADGGLTLKLP
jgi:hypothetical protein